MTICTYPLLKQNWPIPLKSFTPRKITNTISIHWKIPPHAPLLSIKNNKISSVSLNRYSLSSSFYDHNIRSSPSYTSPAVISELNSLYYTMLWQSNSTYSSSSANCINSSICGSMLLRTLAALLTALLILINGSFTTTLPFHQVNSTLVLASCHWSVMTS